MDEDIIYKDIVSLLKIEISSSVISEILLKVALNTIILTPLLRSLTGFYAIQTQHFLFHIITFIIQILVTWNIISIL
jgi:hypothetical protein